MLKLFYDDTNYMQISVLPKEGDTPEIWIRVFEPETTYTEFRMNSYDTIEYFYMYGKDIYKCTLSEQFETAA